MRCADGTFPTYLRTYRAMSFVPIERVSVGGREERGEKESERERGGGEAKNLDVIARGRKTARRGIVVESGGDKSGQIY